MMLFYEMQKRKIIAEIVQTAKDIVLSPIAIGSTVILQKDGHTGQLSVKIGKSAWR